MNLTFRVQIKIKFCIKNGSSSCSCSILSITCSGGGGIIAGISGVELVVADLDDDCPSTIGYGGGPSRTHLLAINANLHIGADLQANNLIRA
ncbi:hypothetical protein DERP_011147 [Dermatophagoides pteronyssinus]|uniref:Uncharacterized protein n=1 Tax=Dermatophagoides pteronyssinus TaxID=6956 RepID=A0ABQ8J9I3_DERPT|nr:hypothetical protein DERP_011147 [Dermatophagoides pteronyssinus]